MNPTPDGLWDELTNDQCAAAMTAMGAAVGLAKKRGSTGTWGDEHNVNTETRCTPPASRLLYRNVQRF